MLLAVRAVVASHVADAASDDAHCGALVQLVEVARDADDKPAAMVPCLQTYRQWRVKVRSSIRELRDLPRVTTKT